MTCLQVPKSFNATKKISKRKTHTKTKLKIRDREPVHCDLEENRQHGYQMMEERPMVQRKHAIAQSSNTSSLLLFTETKTDSLKCQVQKAKSKRDKFKLYLHDSDDQTQMMKDSCFTHQIKTKMKLANSPNCPYKFLHFQLLHQL